MCAIPQENYCECLAEIYADTSIQLGHIHFKIFINFFINLAIYVNGSLKHADVDNCNILVQLFWQGDKQFSVPTN